MGNLIGCFCCRRRHGERPAFMTEEEELWHIMFSVRHDPNRNIVLEMLPEEDQEIVKEYMEIGRCGTLTAISRVAETYLLGFHGDPRKGVDLLIFLAERNYMDAILRLAEMYEDGGAAVERDEEESWKYFQQIMNIKNEREKHMSDETKLESLKKWNVLGGRELDDCFMSGAIRLLDATWVVNYALASSDNIIKCRQELPEEAFITIHSVVFNTRNGDLDFAKRLRIICLSYVWLHPDHPDPNGTTLQTLASALRELIIRSIRADHSHRWGIFWDYASLFQHPDPKKGRMRNEDQEKLFQEGLDYLALLFSQPYTTVFKVTEFPPGYLDTKISDLTTKQLQHLHVPYIKRGWTFTESSWAGLTKSSERTIDISPKQETEMIDPFEISCPGDNDDDDVRISWNMNITPVKRRNPPLIPEDFDSAIMECSFTNQRDDEILVKQLYRDHFVKLFREVKILNYASMGWNDDDLLCVAEIICHKYATQVERILFSRNFAGIKTCTSLSKSLNDGSLPCLELLSLGENETIGDAGIERLGSSIGGIPRLCLTNICMGDAGCKVIADSFERTESICWKLHTLDLQNNPNITHLGCASLAKVMHLLDVLNLDGCRIGDDGCQQLVDAVLASSPSRLVILDLKNNKISDIGCQNMTNLISHCAETLQRINLEKNDDISGEMNDRIQIELSNKLKPVEFPRFY